MVGCDLSGVELRCLAHYLSRYDKGHYAKEILKGDIHTSNQKAAGLKTRDQAKTFIYAFLYGAGPGKIGKIVGGNNKDGAVLKKRFLRKVPGLHRLLEAVSGAAKRGYLIGITGRRIVVQSEHSALNYLLQSLGAYISKQWIVVAHQMIKDRGIPCTQLGWIHDELQFETTKEYADELGEVLVEAAKVAGEELGIKMPIDAEYSVGPTWADTH
jgi:DNA polymerase I-like protein with 3'-5' exonuclease and polymerase domains